MFIELRLSFGSSPFGGAELTWICTTRFFPRLRTEREHINDVGTINMSPRWGEEVKRSNSTTSERVAPLPGTGLLQRLKRLNESPGTVRVHRIGPDAAFLD